MRCFMRVRLSDGDLDLHLVHLMRNGLMQRLPNFGGNLGDQRFQS